MKGPLCSVELTLSYMENQKVLEWKAPLTLTGANALK